MFKWSLTDEYVQMKPHSDIYVVADRDPNYHSDGE